jgi:hypothetical protein
LAGGLTVARALNGDGARTELQSRAPQQVPSGAGGVRELTDEQLRVIIAEACGWRKGREVFPGEFVWHSAAGTLYGQSAIPNYSRSLDAMHEAAETLGDMDHDLMNVKLSRICGDDFYERESHWSPSPIHATARQRAEAFVLTLAGKARGAAAR